MLMLPHSRKLKSEILYLVWRSHRLHYKNNKLLKLINKLRKLHNCRLLPPKLLIYMVKKWLLPPKIHMNNSSLSHILTGELEPSPQLVYILELIISMSTLMISKKLDIPMYYPKIYSKDLLAVVT